MQKVTSLTGQQRNRNRVNVYLDGQFAFGLAASVAARLQVGQTLTPAEIDALQEDETREAARQSAVRFLSYRPRSVAEVRNKLRRAGFDPQLVEEVLAHLIDVALLDDTAFTRYWVEQRETFKPRSRIALRQELRQKGVERAVMEPVLAEVDEMAAARRVIEKRLGRWSHLDYAAFRQKAVGFLQRRGFNHEITREVSSEMWQRLSEQSDVTT